MVSDGLKHPNDPIAAQSSEIVKDILHITGYHVLESIVRDLATADQLAGGNDDDVLPMACEFCGTDPIPIKPYDDGFVTGYEPAPAGDHDENCEWRRAREWVANHPTDGDGASTPQPTRTDPSVPERKDAE